MGLNACSSRECTLGSLQLNESLYATFTRLIALRGCSCPVAPTACAFPSVKASSWRWQLAQEVVPLTEIRLS